MRRYSLLLLSLLLLALSMGPASAQAAGPSGEALPIGDLPGWHQTFADDFTGTVPLGSVGDAGIPNWPYAYNNPDTSGRNGTKSAWDSAKTISVGGGLLDYYLHTANGAAVSGTVGRKASQIYGRYDVRMRADSIPGYKTAFLLWPDSEAWPRDGEIDFPEGDLNGTVGGATHYQGGASGGDQDVWNGSKSATYSGWHTYSIQWTPTALTYQIDGTTVHTTTKRIPNTPMHWVLQAESRIGEGQPPASASGHVQIDWATEYAYAPGTTPVTKSSPTPTPTATPRTTPTATPQPSTAPRTTPTPMPQPNPSATPTGGTAIRINAGGSAYTDSTGNVWQADRYATGGTIDATNIAGATGVFATERWGTNFRYDIPVPNGTYAITLRFIECCNGAVGKRVFNVAINGATVLDHFDIYAEKGWGTPNDRTITATATDGAIHIAFSALSGYPDVPQVAGIIVVGGPAVTSPPATPAKTPTVAPTATPQSGTRRR